MEILTQNEFDVLVYIEDKKEKKEIFKKFNNIDRVLNKLLNLGFILDQNQEWTVTNKGYNFLNPYKVKRAVLLAAGLGSRMNPVTLETPKPLVNVNGTIIIESLLDALIEKEINDITIVTGYLGDQFSIIAEKYPNIKFFHNDKFNEENNISSAMLVKELYAGAYVMDADLLLMNRDIIRKYEFQSNYLGIYVKETDDWRLEITNGKVTNMLCGGKDTYLMVGLSYWSEKDGERFSHDIEKLYSTTNGKQKYWDDVVLTEFNEHYDIYVRECRREDIVEIDAFKELVAIDSSYERYIEG